ncbi:radical SAM protein [Candidatus Bathyarchaeota archaeon]|nr:radical SAM protein [Candidatus Bathyarchaeota archaeon]
MPDSNCKLDWENNPNKLLDYLESGVLVSNPKRIHFYVPSFAHYKTKYYTTLQNRFQTFSITGNRCVQKCAHCEGKILGTMQPTTTPKKLFESALKLKQDGGTGCLISGGCLQDGTLPIQRFIPTIYKIKSELGLTIFVHTGIIDLETSKKLKKAKVDLALIDVFGSDEILKKLDIKIGSKEYIESLKALEKASLDFVPHVIVGLDKEKIKSEFNALKIISLTKPSAIVIIAFVPIQGTKMAQLQQPSPEQIAKVLVATRLAFPKTSTALGCMRPKSKDQKITTEIYALRAGVTAIAFPTEETIKYSKINGYKMTFSSNCCAQIYSDCVY